MRSLVLAGLLLFTASSAACSDGPESSVDTTAAAEDEAIVTSRTIERDIKNGLFQTSGPFSVASSDPLTMVEQHVGTTGESGPYTFVTSSTSLHDHTDTAGTLTRAAARSILVDETDLGGASAAENRRRAQKANELVTRLVEDGAEFGFDGGGNDGCNLAVLVLDTKTKKVWSFDLPGCVD
jgi:hypothetical protein